MKIAFVHEFLTQLGGAERVLQNFLEIWPARRSLGEGGPESEIHVILYNPKKTRGEFEKYQMKVSWLNTLPGIKKHPRLFLALMPGAIEGFKFDDYDLVLSDSSSFAKGAVTSKLHICYCHTPTRFLWTDPEYINQQLYPKIFKQIGKLFLPRLKRWDFKAAQRPDFFIADSVNVQNRIKKYYQRDSVVIPPPVDTELFSAEGGSASGGHTQKQNYFLTASRLEPYKKIEVVIKAFNELGLPLKVVGSGTDSERLKTMAGPNIEFLGRVTDEELRQRYSEAQAYIFPAEEDAGIMILEAQACGTSVIAYRAGGALETIKEGITGEFFDQQTPESLTMVLKNFDPSKYNPQTIREHALQFDKKIFQKKIKEFVEQKYEECKHDN